MCAVQITYQQLFVSHFHTISAFSLSLSLFSLWFCCLQAGQEVEEGGEEEMCVLVGDPVSVVCVDQTTGNIVAAAQSTLK